MKVNLLLIRNVNSYSNCQEHIIGLILTCIIFLLFLYLTINFNIDTYFSTNQLTCCICYLSDHDIFIDGVWHTSSLNLHHKFSSDI